MIKKIIFSTLITIFLIGCGSSDSETYVFDNETEDNIDTVYRGVIEPYYTDYQWEFKSETVLPGIEPDANSKIEEAWQYNKGEKATIAIIDTCFDMYHEDLPNNIIATYNIGDKTSNVQCDSTRESHGVSVLGVVGAPNNGVGTIGVAPNANYILISLPEYLTDLDIQEAFYFARDHGATVISNSWTTGYTSDLEREVFQELKNQGIVILFACGNEGSSLDYSYIDYECEDYNVLGIGSSNELNRKASYSNYGINMDILAPSGEYGIITTDLTGPDGINQDPYRVLKDNDNYTFFAGTSAATPIVAGIVGLMQTANENLSFYDIRDIIINNAEKIGITTEYDSNGFNIYYSYGKINALYSVEAALYY